VAAGVGRWSGLLWGIAVGCLVVATVEAAQLCASRSGTVRMRDACRSTERVVDPAALGFCGCTITTTTTTLPGRGRCLFFNRTCRTDADCSLPGVCNAWGGCTEACSHADPHCPGNGSCGDDSTLGAVCSGCAQDIGHPDAECDDVMTCADNTCVDCCASTSDAAAQHGCPDDVSHCHPECVSAGTPCAIPTPCLH